MLSAKDDDRWLRRRAIQGLVVQLLVSLIVVRHVDVADARSDKLDLLLVCHFVVGGFAKGRSIAGLSLELLTEGLALLGYAFRAVDSLDAYGRELRCTIGIYPITDIRSELIRLRIANVVNHDVVNNDKVGSVRPLFFCLAAGVAHYPSLSIHLL